MAVFGGREIYPSAQLALIIGGAIAAGVADAALVASGRAGARGAIEYLPWRIWLIAPLCWALLAAVIALPMLGLFRRAGGAAVVIALTGFFFTVRLWRARLFVRFGGGLVAIVLLVVIWKVASRWTSRPRRIGAAAAVGVIAAAAVALLVWQRGESRRATTRPSADGPNMIIVFLDTVRYDALFTAAGDVDPALPALSRFARESVVYDRAYAPAPWTLPSHLAAVTGLPVQDLGVGIDQQTYSRPEPTLAERFRRRGYRTAAVISNSFLNRGSGFQRGFDTYEHAANALDVCRTVPGALADAHWPWFAASVCNWNAGEVTERALKQLDDSAGPFFLVLNYMDAHDPYCVERDCGGGPPNYYAAIRCLDHKLVPIIDWRSKRRETVLAILSDHGEQFGEHQLWHHGNSLYVQLLHVALGIRRPGMPAARVTQPVSIGDLPALIGAAPSTAPNAEPVTALLVPPRATGWPVEWSATDASWHLIVRERGGDALYDLAADPAERTNLIGGLAATMPVVERLRAAIRDMQRPTPDSTSFRSLGYVQ